MNPELRWSAAHVFVDSLQTPQLCEDDDHHLRRVLRLGERDTVTVSDGSGRWATARLPGGVLTLTGDVHQEPPMRPVRIATAIPKGDRLEWMVQKLTETGATEITLVDCARSVVRWDVTRGTKHLRRLRRLAVQAAMQSRRVWLPALCGPVPLAAALGPGACVADPSGTPLTASVAAVVIGPEGGFAEEEVGAAPRVSLGQLVMRVETAAVAAAVLLGALREEA